MTSSRCSDLDRRSTRLTSEQTLTMKDLELLKPMMTLNAFWGFIEGFTSALKDCHGLAEEHRQMIMSKAAEAQAAVDDILAKTANLLKRSSQPRREAALGREAEATGLFDPPFNCPPVS